MGYSFIIRQLRKTHNSEVMKPCLSLHWIIIWTFTQLFKCYPDSLSLSCKNRGLAFCFPICFVQKPWNETTNHLF